jgi:tRNA G10  N-methylase Trm11
VIWPGRKVIEPSAGTGNIAVLARLAGADVDTKEIDERRVRLLMLQGFAPTAFDAERLDNLLWPERLYDAVLMNSPFSATGGRAKGHRTPFSAHPSRRFCLASSPAGDTWRP